MNVRSLNSRALRDNVRTLVGNERLAGGETAELWVLGGAAGLGAVGLI